MYQKAKEKAFMTLPSIYCALKISDCKWIAGDRTEDMLADLVISGC